MQITKVSQLSGKTHTLEIGITQEQLDHWEAHRSHMHIQNALPGLDAGEREFLLTGITPQEWSDTFGDEDDNDE